MLILASFTDVVLNPIVNAATEFISSTGLPAVFLLMALESACIPIPSEAMMLFAGFSVSEGELTLIGIIVAGVLGNLVGSWVAYAAGYYGRLDLLEKNRLVHISSRNLARADDWFERYGDATTATGRTAGAPQRQTRGTHVRTTIRPSVLLASVSVILIPNPDRRRT